MTDDVIFDVYRYLPKTTNMLTPCAGTLWSREPSVYPLAAQVLKFN